METVPSPAPPPAGIGRSAAWTGAKLGSILLRAALVIPAVLAAGGKEGLRTWLIAAGIAGTLQAVLDGYGRYAINSYLLRREVPQPGEASLSAAVWALTRVSWAMVVAACLLVLSVVLTGPALGVRPVFQLSLLFCAAGAVSATVRTAGGVQEVRGHYWANLRFEALATLAETAGVCLVAMSGGGLLDLAIVSSVALTAVALGYSSRLPTNGAERLEGDPSRAKQAWALAVQSVPVHAGAALAKATAEGFTVLLAFFVHPAATIGAIAGMRTIIGTSTTALQIFTSSQMPVIQTAYGQGQPFPMRTWLQRWPPASYILYCAGWLLLTPVAAFVFSIWIGRDFHFDVQTFVVLLLAGSATVAASFPYTLLLSLNRARTVLMLGAVRAAAALLFVALFPVTARSAAYALLCAEGAHAIVAAAVATGLSGSRPDRFFFRFLAAGAAGAIGLWSAATLGYSFFWTVPLAVLLCFVGGAILRPLLHRSVRYPVAGE